MARRCGGRGDFHAEPIDRGRPRRRGVRARDDYRGYAVGGSGRPVVDLQRLLSATVSVRTGTDLQFINQGFHTFTILPAGATPRPDWRSNGVGKDDTDDTTLNPNGTTKSEFNIPGRRRRRRPVGRRRPRAPSTAPTVSSGAPFGPPAPFVVHVSAAPGLYSFICRVHAGMSGKLKVVAADAAVPSALPVAIDREAGPARSGRRLGRRPEGGPRSRSPKQDGSTTLHVTAGTSSPDGKVALLEYFPRNHRRQAGRQGRLHTAIAQRTSHRDLPGRPRDRDDRLLRGRFGGHSVRAAGCNGGPPDEIEFGGGNGVSLVTTPTGTVSDSGIIGPHQLTPHRDSPRTSSTLDDLTGRRGPGHLHLRVPDPRRDGGDHYRPLTRDDRDGPGAGNRAKRLRPVGPARACTLVRTCRPSGFGTGGRTRTHDQALPPVRRLVRAGVPARGDYSCVVAECPGRPGQADRIADLVRSASDETERRRSG